MAHKRETRTVRMGALPIGGKFCNEAIMKPTELVVRLLQEQEPKPNVLLYPHPRMEHAYGYTCADGSVGATRAPVKVVRVVTEGAPVQETKEPTGAPPRKTARICELLIGDKFLFDGIWLERCVSKHQGPVPGRSGYLCAKEISGGGESWFSPRSLVDLLADGEVTHAEPGPAEATNAGAGPTTTGVADEAVQPCDGCNLPASDCKGNYLSCVVTLGLLSDEECTRNAIKNAAAYDARTQAPYPDDVAEAGIAVLPTVK